jgi:hypothetical protein
MIQGTGFVKFSITTHFMIQKIFIVDSQVGLGQAAEGNIAEED